MNLLFFKIDKHELGQVEMISAAFAAAGPVSTGDHVDRIAIGQNWNDDVRVVLFVILRDGVNLDDDLQKRIRTVIRQNTTPRHVPAKIVAVPEIPRTKSGKIVELAVRSVVHGDLIKNTEALANPEALAHFANIGELQTD